MTEHAQLNAGGTEVEVVDVDGREGLSELYSITVRGQVEAPVAAKALAGKGASLALYDGFSSTRTVSAIVSRAQSSYHDDGTIWLTTELRPAAWLLTRGRNCRSFQDKSVVDIVTAVLGGVPHRWDTTGSYAIRPYTVQYRQDDWTFICRLLEQEGIYYWFDHQAGSQLVLADDSTAAPDLAGGATIDALANANLRSGAEAIEAIGPMGSVTPTKFSVKSFNPKNPALDVSGGAGGGGLEFYDAPGGGPVDPGEAARQAEMLGKAAAAGGAGAGGTTNSVRAYPGRILAPAGHPSMDGRYLVTQVGYQVRQRRRDGAPSSERAWSCHFAGIDAATPFVPPRQTPLGRQAGIQSAKVVGPPGEEIYPNEDGEVRVEQHWDRTGSGDDQGGTWMRVAQRGTHDSMQLPRVGWNVLTFNDEGSVDAPSVLSRVNDGEHPPAYPLPANKTRVVFKTQTTPADGTFNEIYFEDTKGAEEMFIHASKDMNILIQRVKTDGVGNDQTREIGRDRSLTVARDVEETVERNQSVTIGGDDTLQVAATKSERVEGNLTEIIGGNRTIDVGDDHGDGVGGDRDVAVGAALIDTSLGNIAAGAEMTTLLVGGAQLKMSAKSVSDGHGGVSAQLIGGARLEFSKVDRTLKVEKYLVEAVGGAMLIKTDGTYADAAEQTSTWTAGAMLATETPADMLVKADEKIEIVCGGSTITLLPESVEIKSDELDLSGAAVVETETPIVEHN